MAAAPAAVPAAAPAPAPAAAEEGKNARANERALCQRKRRRARRERRARPARLPTTDPAIVPGGVAELTVLEIGAIEPDGEVVGLVGVPERSEDAAVDAVGVLERREDAVFEAEGDDVMPDVRDTNEVPDVVDCGDVADDNDGEEAPAKGVDEASFDAVLVALDASGLIESEMTDSMIDAMLLDPAEPAIVANVVGVLGRPFTVIDPESIAVAKGLADSTEVMGAKGRSA